MEFMRRSLCDEVCRCISYFYIASVGRWGSNCLGINSITMTRLVTDTGLSVMGLKRKAFVIYIVVVSLGELAKVECA